MKTEIRQPRGDVFDHHAGIVLEAAAVDDAFMCDHPARARKSGCAARAGHMVFGFGGKRATQQDMCAPFWARAAERYLKERGTIAFVLPYAALNAPVYAALRARRMGQVGVRLIGGWSLEKVWPIFGSQSGVSTTSRSSPSVRRLRGRSGPVVDAFARSVAEAAAAGWRFAVSDQV